MMFWFCAAALLQCVDYESIIGDWHSGFNSAACQNAFPAPFFLWAFSSWAHTIAVWWRRNDWRWKEVKRERVRAGVKKNTWRAWWLAESETGKKQKGMKERVVRRCGEHGFPAAAIKRAIFVPGNMLIFPLCEQLIGHCTTHQAGGERREKRRARTPISGTASVTGFI